MTALNTPPLSRALLVLDVDGVLIPAPGPAKLEGGFTDWKPPRKAPRAPSGGRYHVRLSPTMGARLAALPADIVWLTTWGREANVYLLGRLGWTPRPVIDWPQRTLPDSDNIDHRAKADGLATWLDARDDTPPRPIVWVDDELAPGGRLDPDDGAPNPLADRSIDHLTVGTDDTYGLTASQIDTIDTWLREHG